MLRRVMDKRSVGRIVKDGLYRVETRTICAGFVKKGPIIEPCAPILRRRLAYWLSFAKWVCP